ncbi:MAG: KH domain-containing protein [Firmicutes bacterium]|nr:KH domain-containing protein [Bacillota bacterium]MCL2771036.1 KH domain-containing protein [Bacillota bacterium]
MEIEKTKEFVEFLVKELVSNKDAVVVSFVEEENAYVIDTKVHADDLGRIIGKQGKNANAIRTVVKSFAGRGKKHLVMKFN